MTQGKKLLFALAMLLVMNGAGHARSGRAAYHFHSGAMITASRYEPRGSVLRVKNPQNGREVTVRVVDSGPFNGNRILDLSTGAFSTLYGGLGRGVGPVEYVVVSRGGSPRNRELGSTKKRTRRSQSRRSKYRRR